MNIGRSAVKNKYLVISFIMAIIIFGVFAKMNLQTQLAPDTNAPKVTVMAKYPGATAQDVSENLVKPLEESFGKLEGISNIQSDSMDNIGIIHLYFKYGTDVDSAAIDVQNTISSSMDRLPKNIGEPKVLKFNTSDKPIMTLAINSDTMSLKEIRRISEDSIAFELQLIDGVAAVEMFGGYIGEIRITLDENKFNSYNLTLSDISKALNENNISAPGGSLKDGDKNISLKIDENYTTVEELENIRIILADGNSVYLKDIAKIDYSIEDLESMYKFDSEDRIALQIIKSKDANTVETVENIKLNLEEIEKKYPYLDIEIAQDDSTFTNQMVNNMTTSILLAILFTTIIIFLFLSKINQSLVVAFSMPLTFLSTLGLMKLFDMKLDLVTLSALILSIGFVIDNSIVIVENIMKHKEKNKEGGIVSAAINGTNEIASSVLSGTITTIVVLVPLIFMQGFVGEMFKPVSMTLIFALSSSVIIAFTVIPIVTIFMDKFSFSKVESAFDLVTKPFNKMMDWILDRYLFILKKSIKNNLIFVVILVLLLASGVALKNKGIEMLPKFDSGVTYISVETETGTSIEETSRTFGYIEDILEKEENIIGYDTQIGFEKDSTIMSEFNTMASNQGVITINFNTRKEREEDIWSIQDRIRTEIEKIPGIKRFVVKEKGGTANSSGGVPIDIKISGEDQDVLYSLAIDLERELKEIDGMINVYKSFGIDSPEYIIKTNDSRIKELGLNNAFVAKYIFELVEGVNANELNMEDRDENIKVVFSEESRNTIDEVMKQTLITPYGAIVPLSDIAWVEESKRSNIVTKDDLEYTINVLGYTEVRAFSFITEDIYDLLESYNLPNGYEIGLTGQQNDLIDAMADMVFLLGLSVVFVYLVLLPQFKSFILPLVIMASIPLVVIGVAPALLLTNKFVSMPVLLGFIMLAGTVVNNSILLIDYFIESIKSGLSPEQAVFDGVRSRFRPIMMTVLSDVVGMIPLAFQLALGSERFSPLAVTVIGGILASTVLTLILIPVIFYKLSYRGKIAV
jgi:multidrug efflux pump subunit AcrB